MKPFLSVLFFLVCAVVSVPAQVMFQKAFGGTNYDRGQYVKQTNDGGYIIAADISNMANYDIYLIKTDSTGNMLWTKTFPGANYERPTFIGLTNDGGYLIGGYTNSFSTGHSDVLLIKTNSFGDTLWTRTYGDTASEGADAFYMTADGGYIFVGGTTFGAGNGDMFVLKIDSAGNYMWSKSFGGPYPDRGTSVLQTSDGYIIAGITQSFSNDDRIYLIKTNTNGSLVWSEIIGNGANFYDADIFATSDGRYVISAQMYDSHRLFKVNANGGLVWGKALNALDGMEGHSTKATSDGGFIISGETYCPYGNLNVLLVKTDSLGNELWTKSIGDSAYYDVSTSVEQTTDGGYILTGYTRSFGAGLDDVYLIKTDSAGNNGCNESNCVTNVNVTFPSVQFPNTMIANPSNVVLGSAPFIIASGSTATPICLSFVSAEENIQRQNFAYVFPNPAREKFWVRTNSSVTERCVLTILDVTGRKVSEIKFQIEAGGRDYPINISFLKPGLYLVKIRGEKTEQTCKIIKEAE